MLNHDFELLPVAGRKIEHARENEPARKAHGDVAGLEIVLGQQRRQGFLQQDLLFVGVVGLSQGLLVPDAQGSFQARFPIVLAGRQFHGLEAIGTDVDTPGCPRSGPADDAGNEVHHAARRLGPQVHLDGGQSQSLQGQATGHGETSATFHERLTVALFRHGNTAKAGNPLQGRAEGRSGRRGGPRRRDDAVAVLAQFEPPLKLFAQLGDGRIARHELGRAASGGHEHRIDYGGSPQRPAQPGPVGLRAGANRRFRRSIAGAGSARGP